MNMCFWRGNPTYEKMESLSKGFKEMSYMWPCRMCLYTKPVRETLQEDVFIAIILKVFCNFINAYIFNASGAATGCGKEHGLFPQL